MTSARDTRAAGGSSVQQCCANLYESDFARLLLGESFHPGGLALTERLGEMLQLSADDCVLDAACGKGRSAIFLAERFGCEVMGIDYSEASVRQAAKQAEERELTSRVRFRQGDVETLPVADGATTAVVCECSFCTFPSKEGAAHEFARVLAPGGKVGISDLTRKGVLPSELDGMVAWAACVADALPVENYCPIWRRQACGWIPSSIITRPC
jgi:arsenite methyltransferase